MFFHMVYKSGQIFLPFCHNSHVWQTVGRTDRQTEFSSLYHVCITCSAVKIVPFILFCHFYSTDVYSFIKFVGVM